MSTRCRLLLALLFLAAFAAPAPAQAFRFRFTPTPAPRPAFPGGGGHVFIHTHSGGASSTNSESPEWLYVAGVVLAAIAGGVVIYWLCRPRNHKSPSRSASLMGTPAPDPIIPPSQVAAQARRIHQELATAAVVEADLAPQRLIDHFREIFFNVQRGWEERDAEQVRSLLARPLFATFQSQVFDLRKQHLIQRLTDLRVNGIDLVEAEQPGDPERGRVTALLTYTARVGFEDDRTGLPTIGHPELRQYQETWTFQRQGTHWRLAAWRSPTESYGVA